MACALGALVLWAVANAFPILGLKIGGDVVQTTLLGAIVILYQDGMWPISVLVFATTILMPLLEILAVLYLLLPLRLQRLPPRPELAFRMLRLGRSWGMTEVLILGVLVALVKLVHLASVLPGVALWAFGGAMILIAATAAAFDPREVWARIGTLGAPASAPHAPHAPEAPQAQQAAQGGHALRGRAAAAGLTAAQAGLYACHDCGLLSKPASPGHGGYCPRCGASLHFRKPDSIARTWAFLLAAIVLYVPANTLTVMDTQSLFGQQADTIMSGVVYLWTSGSWPLAVIVFIASIAVPMLKILALGLLVVTAQRRSAWMRLRRTRIYRGVELVGRWSMLDIYVIAVLVALVQFSALATIKAGPAAIAFGAVVVLTMLAANAFDPRLIWDQTERGHG